MSQGILAKDVLTLEEVATYLRLPKDTVEQQAAHGQIPGQQIGESWRFLKTAIDDWLRAQNSCEILLQQAGALADDPTLPELRSAIYVARGRSETETT